MMSILRDGAELGTWSEEEIRVFYREGRLCPTDLYWTAGMPQWRPLVELALPPSLPKSLIPLPERGLNRLSFIGALAIAFAGFVGFGTCLQALTVPTSIVSQTIVFPLYATVMGLVAYRLINIGYSPWNCLFFLVPGLNMILVLYCLVKAPVKRQTQSSRH